MHAPRFALLILVPALLVAPMAAGATVLGEPLAVSAIGEPFRVEFRVVSGGTARAGECLRLKPDPREGGLPWVRNGRISAVGAGEASRIVVANPAPIYEPAVRIALEDICETRLRREYTLLLPFPDLPAVATPVAIEAPATLPPPATPPARTPPRIAAPEPKAAPAQRPERAAKAPVTRNEAPRAPATLPAAQPRQPEPANTPPKAPEPAEQDRLVLAGGDDLTHDGLRLSTRLSSFERVATTTDAERDQLRREHQLIAALDRTIMAQMELTERIRRLEEIQNGMLEHAAALSAAGQQEQQAAPPSAPAPESAPPPEQATAGDWLFSGATLAGVSLALAGLLLWLRRRRTEQTAYESLYLSEPGEATEPDLEPATASASAPETPAPVRMAPSTIVAPRAEQPQTRLAQPTRPPSVAETPEVDLPDLDTVEPAPEREPLAWTGADTQDEDTVAPIVVDEEAPEEHESAIELAEIMMGFGRIQGAAETLAEFIRSNPKQAVTPWLKLLDVYKAANARTEFDALAQQLNKTFNVKAVTWDSYEEARSNTRSIEDMGHLIRRIQQSWNTRECQAYLERLLRDNKDGTREGFPFNCIDEILMLAAVLEDHLGPYRLTNEEREAAAREGAPYPEPLPNGNT